MTQEQPKALRYAIYLDALGSEAEAAELRRLHAENEALRQEVHNLNWALGKDDYPTMATPEQQADADAAMQRASERIDELRQGAERYEALRKDAERYRWLRIQPDDAMAPRIDICHWTCEAGDSVNHGEGLRHEDADAAIDAAMKGQS